MATAHPAANSRWPIRYSVQGGSLRVDLALVVAEDATLVVEVFTGASLPQSPPQRLGRFAGRLPEADLATLAAWAPGAAAAPAPSTPVAHGTVERYLTVGGRGPVSLAGAELPPGLEESLATAAAASLDEPIAAVEISARSGHLRIEGLGPQSLPILLFARDIPGYWLRVWREDNGRQEYLPYEAVEQLATAGDLPEGDVALAAGQHVAVPLPPGSPTTGATPATGGFTFWRRGQGPERRIVTGTW